MTTKRYWCSWMTPVTAPVRVLDPSWLGVWVTGWCGGDANMVAWVESDDPDTLRDRVLSTWPGWDGLWRIEPREKTAPPGDRFPRPERTPLDRWWGRTLLVLWEPHDNWGPTLRPSGDDLDRARSFAEAMRDRTTPGGDGWTRIEPGSRTYFRTWVYRRADDVLVARVDPWGTGYGEGEVR
jgi:hypothetical protein